MFRNSHCLVLLVSVLGTISASRIPSRALCDCPKGTVCKQFPVLCKAPPCPQETVCVQKDKPGTCPPSRLLPKLNAKTSCHLLCADDSDCKGETKCCDRGCSRVCVDPEPENPCALVNCGPNKMCKNVVNPCLIPPCPVTFECVDKPAVCPDNYGSFPSCEIKFISCGNDSDCGGNHKCCIRGCSRLCLDPTLFKPGLCPPLIMPDICEAPTAFCGHDPDCGGNQKCCLQRDCTKKCVAPTLPIPIVRSPCPEFPDLITDCAFRPGINCLDDSECPFDHRCCSKGCGKECVPVPTDPSNPCIATTCAVNHHCIVAPNGQPRCVPSKTSGVPAW